MICMVHGKNSWPLLRNQREQYEGGHFKTSMRFLLEC
jgi:hypothetical protein